MASYHGSRSSGDEFAKMERDAAVEEELAALKAAAGKKKNVKREETT
jgi:hypothetical protein